MMPSLRERVIRTMAEIGDADSRRWLREIVERQHGIVVDPRARDSLPRRAGRHGVPADRRIATLDDDGLRERIVRSVAEGGGAETTTWLRGIVRDAKERSTLRERAVRSLAESGAATSELVALYDSVTDRTVRDRLVSVLAERGDRAARDKLRAIATDDPDEDLRRRATRKLAESSE